MVSRALILAAVIAASCPGYAGAQIYAWRDANGTITASSGGSKVATGSYKLSMSNTPDCQMKGHGTWSMESDKFTVSGNVVTCVNWEASIDNFLGTIDVSGEVTIKEPPAQQQSSGPLRRIVRGLLGGLFG